MSKSESFKEAAGTTKFATVNVFFIFAFASSLLFAQAAFSQNWPGYETGRFSGISSANIRPGGMATTPYKADATLFGLHVLSQTQNLFTNNDAVGLITTGGFKGLKGFSKLASNRTTIYSNVQGPSVLYSVNPKLSVAFAWNVRFLWSSALSEPKLVQIFDEDISNLNLTGSGETATTLFNSWNDFGLGAGGEVFRKNQHSISAGGFVKLVLGTGSVNFQLDNIEVSTTDTSIEHIGFNVRALVSQQAYELVDEGKVNLFDRIGYGFDLGAEYRIEDSLSHPGAGNYRLKVGFSLTDIGQTKYNSALQYNNISVSADNISLSRFRDVSTFEAAIDTIEEIFDIDTSGSSSGYGVTLPMSLRFYGDYNFGKSLGIYTELQFLFAKMMFEDANMPVLFKYNLTPRFEDHRFGVYLPITFTNYIPANVGLALRWKPFIIGSANLFTFWAYEKYGKPLDLYLAVKIPILKGRQKIRDGRKKQ